MKLDVLFEDNHLLVVNKPAGLATMGKRPGEPSLIDAARDYLKQKYHKPGNVYLGVVSRLDALVSGVIVFARTSKAAARLSEQFREHTVRKTYLAVVGGILSPPAGTLVDWLLKDEREQRMKVVRANAPGALEARLDYRTLSTQAGRSLVEIELHTGRKHQIRVQLASRGHPILGDAKYGGRERFAAGIALHSSRLELDHPISKQHCSFQAPTGIAFG